MPSGPDMGVRIGRRGRQVVVEWERIGRFVSSTSGREGTFWADKNANVATLEKFRATGLMACRRYLDGRLSLHGSAVGLPGGAVALVGESGVGKSTTAMALVEENGAKFMADDVVPIDWDEVGPVVSPVEDSFWLARDASVWFGLSAPLGEKRACAPRERSPKQERLNAIVYLVFDDDVHHADLQPVTGADAFVLLNGTQVGFSIGSDEETLRNFAIRARLASTARVFRLRRPRTLDCLRMAARLLTERLATNGPFEGRA